MKRFICTKVDGLNSKTFTLGKVYETDDEGLNAVLDTGWILKNTTLTQTHSSFVEIPCIGDKILIKDGSKIEDYICGWSNSKKKLTNQLFTYYELIYSKEKDCIKRVGFYTKEKGREYVFDSRAVTILGSPEAIHTQSSIVESDESKEIDNPLSFIKSGGLVIRRNGSKAIILDCKEGLYLAAKDLTKLRYVTEYEIDGTCRGYTDDFDIMEIYDLDEYFCDFETTYRKLLWKRKSKEVKEIEKKIRECQKTVKELKQQLDAVSQKSNQ